MAGRKSSDAALNIRLLILIVIFATAATMILAGIFASRVPVSFEPEDSVLSISTETVRNDNSASGNGYVLFGGETTPPPVGSGCGGGLCTFYRPFNAESIWNTPLAANVGFEDTGTTAFIEGQRYHAAGVQRASIWGHPFWRGTASDPLYTITSTGLEDWDIFGVGGRGFVQEQVRVPDGAWRSGGLDGHFAVLDETTGQLWELYMGWGESNQPDHFNRTISAGTATRQPIDGNGQRGGPRAHGIAAIGGMIRLPELQAGRIEHKMALMLFLEVLNGNGDGYEWPANRRDGFSYPNFQPWAANMGDIYAIPRTTSIDSLGLSSNYGRIVATALQEYGGIVSDQSGLTSIGVMDQEVEGAGWEMPFDDASKIANALRRVNTVTESNPTGAQ